MDSSRLPLKDDQIVNEEIQALVKKHLDETRLVQGTSVVCSVKLWQEILESKRKSLQWWCKLQ